MKTVAPLSTGKDLSDAIVRTAIGAVRRIAQYRNDAVFKYESALAVCLALLISVPAIVNAEQVTITHSQSGMAIDVQGASSESGAIIWQHPSNKTIAQAFDLDWLSGAESRARIRTLTGEDLVLAAQTHLEIENLTVEDIHSTIKPSVFQRQQIAVDSGSFTNIFQLQAARKQLKYQQWKLVPIAGLKDSYRIQNAAWSDLFLAPRNPQATSALALFSEESANEQNLVWRIERLRPRAPTEFEVEELAYSGGKVSAKLRWVDRSSAEDRFEITIRRTEDDKQDTWTALKNQQSAEASFDLGAASRNKRHCLIVAAVREHHDTFSTPSDEVCKTAVHSGGGNDVQLPQTICGIGGCPVGFHAEKFLRTNTCVGNLSVNNATECHPDTGFSFLVCGTGPCPTGYERSSLVTVSNCDPDGIGTVGNSNAQICSLVD
ncbi:MAG: hypothetical protein AAF542_23240 [Pseudomonadota bacterium]